MAGTIEIGMKHFFDVGANNGSTFDRFLNKTNEFDGERVWCFEPSPRCWPELLFKAEQLSSRYRISVCPFGMDGKWGTFPFYQQEQSEGDSFIANPVDFHGHEAKPANFHYSLVAPQVPISDFIIQHTFLTDQITIKLDCEGSEYAILQNLLDCKAARDRCLKILVEWHWVTAINYQKERERLMVEFGKIGLPLELWGY